MKPETVCPTCGSPYLDVCISAWDADVPFKNRPVSKKLDAWCVFDSGPSGKWYCGYCPDAWHDSQRSL